MLSASKYVLNQKVKSCEWNMATYFHPWFLIGPFITELRLAQLALDPNNSPAWDVLEQERKCVSTKMPLYVKAYCGYHSKQRQSEMGCGTSYTIFIQTATRALRPQT